MIKKIEIEYYYNDSFILYGMWEYENNIDNKVINNIKNLINIYDKKNINEIINKDGDIKINIKSIANDFYEIQGRLNEYFSINNIKQIIE